MALGGAAVCLKCFAGMNSLGVRCASRLRSVGLVLWVRVEKRCSRHGCGSVTLAFFIPARTRIDPDHFVRRTREC
jgi:Na+/H+ antiporter NhaA